MKEGWWAIVILLLVVILVSGCSQNTRDSGSGQIPGVQLVSTQETNKIPTQQTVMMQPQGNPDPAFKIEVFRPDKVWKGTTIFSDNHDPDHPRIVEVSMAGEVIWQYDVPADMKKFLNPGEDVEPLPNGNILMVFPRLGIFEINKKREVVWKYLDPKVSHDADRLPNGNTIVVFGGGDTLNDAQVKEINPKGQIVWTWYARDQFNKEPYTSISKEGWTHTNAVTRLPNGNTLISPRNFNFLIEVDRDGKTVRIIGEGRIESQHDPEILPNGNILMVNQMIPHTAIEMNPNGEIVWNFSIPNRKAYPVRDANRLENGNTLITAADRILEVTPQGEVVWMLMLKDVQFTTPTDAQSYGFYKATRISA